MTNISKAELLKPWQPDEKEAPSQQRMEHSSNALVVATTRSGRRKGLADLRSVIACVTKAAIGCPAPQGNHGARPRPLGNGKRVATSSKVKSSKMSKNDDNTPPESFTLQLKKDESAVEVATAQSKQA
jgi:hypothetical protein